MTFDQPNSASEREGVFLRVICAGTIALVYWIQAPALSAHTVEKAEKSNHAYYHLSRSAEIKEKSDNGFAGAERTARDRCKNLKYTKKIADDYDITFSDPCARQTPI